MGYNSWYDYGCNLNQPDLEETSRAMHSQGLIALGYSYFNLDDCWAGGRHPNGTLYAQPGDFPSGTLRPLADYVHSFDMKFGTYTCRGDLTCAGRPGALGHERIDAETYAAWGVDYLKEDSCHLAGDNHSLAIEQYSLMRDSLNHTGRPIFFALCGWFPWYAGFSKPIGNMWRTGLDGGSWLGILSNIDTIANLAQYASPGGFNDPCLLISTDHTGRVLATERQSRAQFSMWAVMASPLLISGDIRKLSPYVLETYKNSEVIAVNQDLLGKQGVRLAGGPLTGQTYLSACDEEDPAQKFTLGSGDTQGFIISPPSAGTTAETCFMAWCPGRSQAYPLFGPCAIGGAPTCGGNKTVLHPDQSFTFDQSTGQIGSALDGIVTGASWGPLGRGCMSISIFPYIDMETCAPAAAVPALQQWSFNGLNSTGSIKHQASGSCLTRVGISTTNVWGRALHDGSYAMLFLNTGPNPMDVTCGEGCWAATGWPARATTVEVRDLWNHTVIGTRPTSAPFTVGQLDPDGGVALFLLTPSTTIV